MSSIFEFTMLACFGLAWPVSIYKSWKSRSTGGKSLAFMIVVEIGYLSGIIYKLTGNFDYVFYLYVVNTVMVLIDILLYIRNYYFATACETVKQ